MVVEPSKKVSYHYNVGFADGLVEGRKEGKQEARAKILTLLEQGYLDPQVSRDSERGKAMMALARELGEEFRKWA